MRAKTSVVPEPTGSPILQRLPWIVPATTLALIAVIAVSVIALTRVPPPPPALLHYQATQNRISRQPCVRCLG